MVKTFCFVGISGSGKTTLIERLIPILRSRGHRVAAVKHTHHEFEMDKPGKDSHRLKAAGAEAVVIASSKRLALVADLLVPPKLSEIVSTHFSNYGIVLAEGFHLSGCPKVLVWRNGGPGDPEQLLERFGSNIHALVTDSPGLQEHFPGALPIALNDVERLADFIESFPS